MRGKTALRRRSQTFAYNQGRKQRTQCSPDEERERRSANSTGEHQEIIRHRSVINTYFGTKRVKSSGEKEIVGSTKGYQKSGQRGNRQHSVYSRTGGREIKGLEAARSNTLKGERSS